MAVEPNAVEQAVSRTLRDNLEKIQRNADELHQAVNDMVSACASNRASNALPSMMRAQTSAAAIAATLEVLSRFVTGALQPPMRMSYESDSMRVPSMGAPPPAAFEQPPPLPPHPKEELAWNAPAPVAPPPIAHEVAPPVQRVPPLPPAPPARPPMETPAFSARPAAMDLTPAVVPASVPETPLWSDPDPGILSEASSGFDLELPVTNYPPVEIPAVMETVEAAPKFNLDLLPPEEQELHRRAFRVAKVSMQDIRMLRPEDVRLGREKKDLCSRLRDDIEKAHKEYDRRFQSIQGHPVDYFYDWMVEILGGGDPHALGEYPYPSPVLRR